MTISVAIVIPTRNRSGLAMAAIRSLLAIDHPRLDCIVVSNNSSEPEHARALAAFCEESDDRRLIHIAPARALGMADHWDWATRQTLARSDATHVALHYDRRVSSPDLALLLDLTVRWPERPITYLLDIVYPALGRFFVHQAPWSGGLFEIAATRAIALAATGRLTDLWQAFPVLVNSVTPRAVFERVLDRFGSVCASTSPESCFGFRFAAIEESYLHFDRPLGVHYGYAHSNGMGYMRGEATGTFGDFLALHGDRPWLDAAPLPGLSLGQNSFYHEYGCVQREAGLDRFPRLDMDAYLADLARGLYWIDDPARRAQAETLLVRHGWRGRSVPPPPARVEAPWRMRLAAGARRWRADHLRALPGDLRETGFEDEARALSAAQKFGPPASTADALAPFDPVRLD